MTARIGAENRDEEGTQGGKGSALEFKQQGFNHPECARCHAFKPFQEPKNQFIEQLRVELFSSVGAV